MNALISGFSTGLSLIVSIGAQNNYVLKNLIENNNKSFDDLGATAIQGSANLKT